MYPCVTISWRQYFDAFLTLIEPAGLIDSFNLKRLNYLLSLSQHAGDLGQLCLLPRAQIFTWDQTKFAPSWERLGNLHAGTFTLRQAENSEGLVTLKWEVLPSPIISCKSSCQSEHVLAVEAVWSRCFCFGTTLKIHKGLDLALSLSTSPRLQPKINMDKPQVWDDGAGFKCSPCAFFVSCGFRML